MPDGTVLLQGGRRRSSSSRAASVGAGSGSEDARGGLRAEHVNGSGHASGAGAGQGTFDSEDEESAKEDLQDPESKAKHEAFAAKRKGHYGNEAEALKIAKALAAQEDEEDEDDQDGGGLPPPVPALPNGHH